ncbi:uncharacterized protein LOC127283002 [Leptopilina boulardi]|uniref:uncharacterized protein LOC127283002 n=1 Tax=Leptopilina boulardi TaxID=63433 RepID=UPI0021F69467|nr:uncharacterized protein LOC127283002 [Leptopilina boulardi]
MLSVISSAFFTTTEKMAHFGYISLILCLLASANAISRCNDDRDCPEKEYCYDVSHRCSNYTICSRYNRLEGKESARHPSNCGPCISGYEAEISTIGEPNDICKKTVIAQKEDESDTNKTIYTWLYSSMIIIVIGAILLCTFMRKPCKKLLDIHMRKNSSWTNMCNFGPSAPPLGTGSYIEVGGSPHYTAIMNNNDKYMDKNKLVAATPFHNPDWIKPNPNYNEPQEIPEQVLTPEPIPPEEDTNPSSWTPEQTSELVPTRPFAQFNAETRDNAMNAVLVQRNCPAVSTISENNDSTSENTDSQSNSDHIRGPNILISQKITMNVNVVNGDY